MKTQYRFSLKIILDAVMLLLLLTFYQKRTISMAFHETAGLILFGLFLLHTVLNRRWLINVTQKLFRPSTQGKTRAGWLVDILLAVTMTGIAVTGLMITKTLPFRLAQFSGAKQLHYFCAALSIVLMGIHLGLHWQLIRGLASKAKWLQGRTVRCVGILLLTACLCFGIYSLCTGSFSGWITGPFTGSAGSHVEFRPGTGENGEAAPDFSQKKGAQRPSGEGTAAGQGISAVTVLYTLAQYGCEMLTFAVPTAVLLRKKNPEGKRCVHPELI